MYFLFSFLKEMSRNLFIILDYNIHPAVLWGEISTILIIFHFVFELLKLDNCKYSS